MIELIIADMTCNHCVQAITRAVGATDARAKLAFDLPNHRVRVTSDAAPGAICQAIEEAGYTVQQDELKKDVPKASGCVRPGARSGRSAARQRKTQR